MSVQAVVYREHTLGYMYDDSPYIGILSGKVSKGGLSIQDAPPMALDGDVRPATIADFDNFNVKYQPDYKVVS